MRIAHCVMMCILNSALMYTVVNTCDTLKNLTIIITLLSSIIGCVAERRSHKQNRNDAEEADKSATCAELLWRLQ